VNLLVRLDGDTLLIRRDLPLPAELSGALNEFKTRQQAEAEAFGTRWSGDRLIAVREDGSPIRHEWYSDEFQRLRQQASLRRIHLKGLRNTSVSLMLAGGMPVHVVAASHGHNPAVSLSIYSHAQRDDLRAAAAALFS
jgi:site-specific recombinase XerD